MALVRALLVPVLLVSAFNMAGSAAAQPAAQYVVFDIGTLGGHNSVPVALNGRGQIAGTGTLPGEQVSHAFFWSAATGMLDIGTLGGTRSEATDLNEKGQVVGTSSLPGDNVSHAFLWSLADGMLDLGSLENNGFSSAAAINNNGQVVGSASVTTPAGQRLGHGFSWTNGTMVDIGTLGNLSSSAVDVNDSGVVVGTSLRDISAFHAFAWTAADNKMVDIGQLLVWPKFTESYAESVTANGQILGLFYESGTTGHAFTWSPTEGSAVPASLPGGVEIFPRDMNGAGQMVGYASTNGFFDKPHGFFWTRSGGTIDLGTLGGTTSGAFAVRDDGLVAGSSLVEGDALEHAFTWTTAGGMVDIGAIGDSDSSKALLLNETGQVVGSNFSTIAGQALNHAVVWTDIAATGARLTARLVAGNLPAALIRALNKKVDAALAKWEHGNINAAANQLNAFGAEVNAKRGRTVTDAEADELADIAAGLAFAINNGTLPATASE